MRKLLLSLIVLAGLLAVGYVLRPHHSAATETPSAQVSTTTTIPSPPEVCVATTCSTWKNAEPWTGVTPSIMTTVFTPFTAQPAVHAYVAWINTATTGVALFPGYKGPGPSAKPRGPEMVPLNSRSRLLATFNSGFYESDTAAGFYTHNILYFPMRRGIATLVQYKDGTVNIVSWTGAARPDSSVLMARQNLSLMINDSVPTPTTLNNSLWGLTLHGVPAVWRTALAIDAGGNLMYVAAPEQTAHSLSIILTKIHAVRAMQLDINPAWPIFVTYANKGAAGPALFVPNPNQIARRFLYPSTKDFFAVFATKSPGEPLPW